MYTIHYTALRLVEGFLQLVKNAKSAHTHTHRNIFIFIESKIRNEKQKIISVDPNTNAEVVGVVVSCS